MIARAAVLALMLLAVGPAQQPSTITAPGVPTVLWGSMVWGFTDVMNAPAVLTGHKPFVDPNTVLPPNQQVGVQERPWIAGIGRTVGEVLTIAPVLFVGSAALPQYLPFIGGWTGYQTALCVSLVVVAERTQIEREIRPYLDAASRQISSWA